MSRKTPATIELIGALGEVARKGGSGRIHFSSAAGPAGGFLTFSNGFLRSVRPPTGSGWKQTNRRDRAGVLAEILRLCRESAHHDARFTAADEAAPLSAGIAAADLAIALAPTIDDASWLQRKLLEERRITLSRPATAPVTPPDASTTKGPIETFLIARSSASAASNTLDQVLASSPGPSLATLQSIHVLHVTGMIALEEREQSHRPASRPAAPPPSGNLVERVRPPRSETVSNDHRVESVGRSRPRTPEQEEYDELLQRTRSIGGMDHYSILEIPHRATESEIRASYYRFARRFHPDKVRRPHLTALLPKLEAMFAAMTEAYNTLTDPLARAEYDRTLMEMASGRATPDVREQQAQAKDLFSRGRRCLEAKQLFEALGYFEAAVRADPTRAEYFHHLGACQGRNPRWRKKSEENLLKAIEMNPGSIDSYRELARIYKRGGLATRAEEMYRKVLEWEPEDREALEMTGDRKSGGGLLGSLFGKS